MNPFSSITASDLGVQASDVVTAGTDLVTVLAPLVILGVAIAFAPALIGLIRKAVRGNSK